MTTERWQIDSAHSGIHFSVRHLVIAKVRGQFTRWNGSIEAPDGDASRAGVEVTIDASSISTGVADRDTHLRSADFLDVENHPEITYKSTRVEKLDGERLRVHGELTIHGATRPVVLNVEDVAFTKDPWGNQRAGFNAKTSIERSAFGLTWNQLLEAGGVAVADRIDIELEIEAVKQVREAAASKAA
jgi:polyisoprenoid-binding protein YceI